MKNYLSFGGGVNSVAMYLHLKDEAVEFEAIFVDHGTDRPETYEYVDMFISKGNPITILKPLVQGFDNLYEFCWFKKFIPDLRRRWCTDKFKIRPIYKYVEKPCFCMLGIDFGEAHRARLSLRNGVENRFPLIEAEIDREGCKKIIKAHGLPVPRKSGCYICPFQRRGDWKDLRRTRPDLFCKAEQLENRKAEALKKAGKKVYYISPTNVPLKTVVDERQAKLWADEEYPPCECML